MSKKAVSFEERIDRIRRAVYAAAGGSRTYADENFYVEYVYEGYAIVRTYEGAYYRVDYTEGTDGVTAQPRADWQAVEKEWAAKSIVLAQNNQALKALGNGKIGGYLVLFTDAASPDLAGEFFDASTDFDIENGAKTAVYYQHGLDETLKRRKLGTGTLRKDDVGVWLEAQLELRDSYEKAIYGLVEAGKCGLSSGSVAHLVEREPAGKATHIKYWPLGLDASITPTPCESRTSVLPLKSYQPAPQVLPQAAGDAAADTATANLSTPSTKESRDMTPEEIQALVANALKADREAVAAQAAAAKAEQDKVELAVKTALEAQAAEWAAKNRLPDGGPSVPYVGRFGDVRKYDHLDAGDTAVLVGVLDSAKSSGTSKGGASEAARKALAIKLSEDKSGIGAEGQRAMKAAGLPFDGLGALKANELNQSTLASYGDEWVGQAYSQTLWEKIRVGTFVANRLPTIEVPQGYESITIPLEGSAPTFYKVGQTSAEDATSRPTVGIASSKLGTDKRTLTLGKMGARIVWSGEMEEDSLIPFAAELRRQLEAEGAEVLEHVVLDGDTATAATTNINHIGGTPGATDVFLLFDGMRKLALVTNTANARSAGGSLADTDFLATVQLMGGAGINGLDRNKVSFVIDPNVMYKALTLASVKTRDVNAAATVESGMLTRIFGYNIDISANLCRASAVRLSNAAGKVDQTTPANNTKGSILAVRWDQFRMGFRRRMTMETTRYPSADATEIVALMRVGLLNRDSEAVALTYNVGV